MRKHKRPRLHSPVGDKSEESEANSFDSGVEVSNPSLDESCYLDSLAGKIESLHMINFMCHSNLEVSFNKRITFVTGRNGSGKSAIMAALIVALGGTANVTGRGSGITDFIKKGETWAKVSITLVNEGINSYKKNIYGNRIVIIRGLSANQASTYVCKSGLGEVISTKKEEVDRICTALDLQIKNPICILNQDVARSFLSATDSNIRYSMFTRATHLENLKLIYSDTIDLLRASQKELESKKLDIDEACKEISQLKEKLEYFAFLEKYVHEKNSLENEYLWSLVALEEKTIQELADERDRIEGKKKEFLESEANFQTVVSQLENDIKELQDRISNLGNNKGEDKIVKRELQAEIHNFQKQIDSAHAHLKQLTAKSERQLSDINSIKEHLKQNEEAASSSQAEKEQIREKIEKLKEDLSEIRDRIETTQRDADNGQETKLQHTMALENLNSDLRDLERAKRSFEVQVERTTNVGDNSLLKYGPFTPKLRELIDEAERKNQFLKKPVGPCGLYVKLSGDNKWARAVESVIGGLMNTYCCDNQKDFEVLNSLMERVCNGKKPPVIISTFQNGRHNIVDEKISVRGHSSVLDVLHFSNDVVYNTFIDQSRLETVLLFETDEQAASLMSHIQNVPKNLRMGLTVNSDQYYPAPNYRTYAGDTNRVLKYFDGPMKTKAVKEKLESEVRKSQLAIKEKNMEIAEMTSKLVKVTEFLRKTEANLRLLKQKERKMEAQIKELKDEEESKPVPPKRAVLEEELTILQKNEEELQTKISKDKEAIEALMRDKQERVQKLEEMTASENNLREEISKLQEKLDDSKLKLSRQKDLKKDASMQLAETQKELDKNAEKISSAKKSLANKLKTATEVHPERIHTERSPVEVQEMLDKCEKYLRAAEKKTDSKEVVISEYKTKHNKYKEMKMTIEVLERVVESLTQAALSKKERYKLLQKHTANLVSLHFQACLQTRGYDGRLKFDFQKQTLEIEVIQKDGNARKDTKTLSGGERSYSTVSFILAIWRAVQMPFYILDEFDVFMDKVNRKVIMDLLLEHAKNQTKMQFIFITPLDISAIQASDIVSLYRMPDPRK